MLEWKVISQDNILDALLKHHLDDIAVQYSGYYSHFLDYRLLVESIANGNMDFLRKALLLGAFDKQIFKEEMVIDSILGILKDGYRTNFLMNILILIDFSNWKNKYLKELLDTLNEYIEDPYDKNKMLLSPNPLMTIALASEIIDSIKRVRRKFENECNRVRDNLLELGKMYSLKIEDDSFYESLIRAVDFKNRSVLKIITEN